MSTFLTTYLYTLSALLQGFAALITLVAMFIIFRLQMNREEISEATKELFHAATINYDDFCGVAHAMLSNFSPNDLIKTFGEELLPKAPRKYLVRPGTDPKEYEKQIQESINNLKNCLNMKDKIIFYIWWPLILSSSVVGLSIFFLPCAYTTPETLLKPFLYLTIGIAILGLLSTVVVIIKILNLNPARGHHLTLKEKMPLVDELKSTKK